MQNNLFEALFSILHSILYWYWTDRFRGRGGGRVFLETENVLKIEISGLAHDKEFRKSSSSEKAIYTLQNER